MWDPILRLCLIFAVPLCMLVLGGLWWRNGNAKSGVDTAYGFVTFFPVMQSAGFGASMFLTEGALRRRFDD